MIGTDAIKRTILSRLKLEAPGPGFMHFPMSAEEEYFKQLTAESLIKIREKGEVKFIWKKTGTQRGLDCRVYGYVRRLNPDLNDTQR
jgi:phage terminase large subunit GpA-like protein